MKWWALHLLPLYLLFQSGLSQTVVKSLPGLPGDLPFYLETGYIGVGESEDVQLFYYFIKSERSPKDDPLVLWLTGGPGCSALSGLLYEIGPFTFDYEKSTRDSPILKLHEYSWTKVANIIFLDQPVGTGFSYANSWESYNMNDSVAATESYEFLRKWLKLHPEFLSNPLYIAGDSYSGVLVPMITLQVSKENEAGLKPKVNLQGYLLGNPMTDPNSDVNSRVAFAHLKALISDELYESANINCNGDYVNVDKSNADCVDDLKVVTKCLENIYAANILEPTCASMAPKLTVHDAWEPSLINEDRSTLDLPTVESPRVWCRSYNYLYSYIWASDRAVQDALHIRERTIKMWVRCNESLSYTYTVKEVIDVHKELIKRGVRVLIYSGDHDMVIPYVGTMGWIGTLNMTISRDWEAWFVDGQVAGYTTLYSYLPSLLTYATVKGGGHTAPEYKPKECFEMINSGDHDMVVPYVGTLAWIETLNLTISQDWEAWFVDGQVDGYTTLYSYFPSLLTYATVKGGGYTASEYKPKECFELINRWFDYYYI